MSETIVKRVLVLGGGSAGFLAAITLKTKLPDVEVTVLRSSALGIIGVGEGTTAVVPNFLHGYLKMPPGDFIRGANPTYKLGLKFLWGPRPYFNYTFEPQFDGKYSNLAREPGFYCDESIEYACMSSSLMTHDRVFARRADGAPVVINNHAYHFENAQFVAFLESYAAKLGVIVIDETVKGVEQDENGVKALACESGREVTADLFVDCSGFISLLLGKTFQEPFASLKKSLFCDRAVVGGWNRGPDEVIQPYTMCETMNSGWCWRIDHENRINRGYVYSAAFISDEEARREFKEKNPKVGDTRVVPFVSGYYQRAWIKNVVAVGNAAGFVEPLEATALGVICNECHNIAHALLDDVSRRITPGVIAAHNKWNVTVWEGIASFLAIHYRLNTRLDTEFWKACRSDVELRLAEEYVAFYQDCGPGRFWTKILIKGDEVYGPEGYLTMMVGMKVPHRNRYAVPDRERQMWETTRQQHRATAMNGFTVQEALDFLRRPNCRWDDKLYNMFTG
jgi:tryptophan 7-halogenase